MKKIAVLLVLILPVLAGLFWLVDTEPESSYKGVYEEFVDWDNRMSADSLQAALLLETEDKASVILLTSRSHKTHDYFVLFRFRPDTSKPASSRIIVTSSAVFEDILPANDTFTLEEILRRRNLTLLN